MPRKALPRPLSPLPSCAASAAPCAAPQRQPAALCRQHMQQQQHSACLHAAQGRAASICPGLQGTMHSVCTLPVMAAPPRSPPAAAPPRRQSGSQMLSVLSADALTHSPPLVAVLRVVPHPGALHLHHLQSCPGQQHARCGHAGMLPSNLLLVPLMFTAGAHCMHACMQSPPPAVSCAHTHTLDRQPACIMRSSAWLTPAMCRRYALFTARICSQAGRTD